MSHAPLTPRSLAQAHAEAGLEVLRSSLLFNDAPHVAIEGDGTGEALLGARVARFKATALLASGALWLAENLSCPVPSTARQSS